LSIFAADFFASAPVRAIVSQVVQNHDLPLPKDYVESGESRPPPTPEHEVARDGKVATGPGRLPHHLRSEIRKTYHLPRANIGNAGYTNEERTSS
jgi:hypothetical protein